MQFLRTISALLAILLLLGLSAISTSRLLASVYADYGNRLAESRASNLNRAGTALDVATRLWPLDAEYYNQLGLLAVRAGDFSVAEDAYLQSLRLRPTWPYTWGNLAQYRLTRGLTDELFTSIWEHGLELGPAEDRLHLAYGQIGLSAWYRLSRQQRAALRRSLDYLLTAPNAENSLIELRLFAQRQRLQPLLCRLSNDAITLKEWCERHTDTRRASLR